MDNVLRLFRGEGRDGTGRGKGARQDRAIRGGEAEGGKVDKYQPPFPDHPSVPRAVPPMAVDQYRIDEFYTRSTDNRGHRVTLRVSIPQDMGVVVGMATAALPGIYQSQQDFVRDSILHRAHWIAQNQGDLDLERELNRQRLHAELERMELRLEADFEYAEKCRTVLEGMLGSGDVVGVSGLVMGMRQMMDLVGEQVAVRLGELVDRGERWVREQDE